MTQPVCLVSNFHDHYDHHFDSPHFGNPIVFRRMSNEGPSRRDQLNLLDTLGLQTPWYATATETLKLFGAGLLVVAYFDEQAHRGEGKELLPVGELAKKAPAVLCSEFLTGATRHNEAISYRHAQIGERAFWLMARGRGFGVWRSNYAPSTSIRLLHEVEPLKHHALNEYPVFAIDFVLHEGNNYAIDFNCSPGLDWLKETGITPQEIAERIKERVRRGHV